jgi:hypothetical protein
VDRSCGRERCRDGKTANDPSHRILPCIPISLVLRSALLSLSKDARVSKDGHN